MSDKIISCIPRNPEKMRSILEDLEGSNRAIKCSLKMIKCILNLQQKNFLEKYLVADLTKAAEGARRGLSKCFSFSGVGTSA
jgi:hypothetical protein